MLAELIEFNEHVYPLGAFTPAPALQIPGEDGLRTTGSGTVTPEEHQRMMVDRFFHYIDQMGQPAHDTLNSIMKRVALGERTLPVRTKRQGDDIPADGGGGQVRPR